MHEWSAKKWKLAFERASSQTLGSFREVKGWARYFMSKWKLLERLNSKASLKWTAEFHGAISTSNAFLKVWGRKAITNKTDRVFKKWKYAANQFDAEKIRNSN